MNLFLLLELAVEQYDDRVACGPRSGGLTYTRAIAEVRRIASVVAAADVGAIAFVGLNGSSPLKLVFACAAAGVPFVPLNYRLPAVRLAELVGRLDRPLVVADAEYIAGLSHYVPHVQSTTQMFAAAQTLGPLDALAEPVEPAVVLFTSGTTAAPKAVQLGHDNLVSYVLGTVEFASATSDEAALVSLPPYHVAGISATLSNVYAGRRMVYLPNFDAAEWLELASRESITHAMVVPTMLARIVDAAKGSGPEVPRLRSLAYGGAKVPTPVLLRALDRFPHVGFINAYGLTETSSTIAVLGPEEHRAAVLEPSAATRARLASIGKLVPGIEAQIRDAAGRLLGPGLVGELWVRGAQVSAHYRDTGSALDHDGWFPTRDRAWADDDGYLFIAGRIDDVIIRAAENIHPAEIEDILIQHPGVSDVSVVGIPDEIWGERIAAVVVASGDVSIDADEIRRYVRARLRGSRTPDDVVLCDALPYGLTGKLARRDIVDLLQRGLLAAENATQRRSANPREAIP